MSFVPGRINLIGEHTDYNAGLALPCAIDLGVRAEATLLESGPSLVTSDLFGTTAISADPSAPLYARMTQAVLDVLNYRQAVSISVTSTLPDGAGLSSSAAFLGAIYLALATTPPDLITAALDIQRAEALVGSHVGLLDPLATLGASKDSALLIDFATLTTESVPLPAHWGLSVVHSEVTRELSQSKYAERRAECDAARDLLGGWDLAANYAALPSPLAERARHVWTENQRVRDFVDAARHDDIVRAGELINASHNSLSQDFDVSLPLIDELARELRGIAGVHGVRMMGGGFGGCLLVLHDEETRVEREGHRSWRVRPAPGGLARL